MNKNNCPNCGAPINAEKNKCEYCGTSYFDLSAIDIDGGEPFYLKLKTKAWNGKSTILTALVRANPNIEINISQDNVYVEFGGSKRMAFPSTSHGELNMSFTTVPNHFKNTHFIVEQISE